ncbi:MAG: ATPase, partial [Ktedonobacteraceae bacterium]|nr:ATPase [Ktedonobacteraceae bacterium]
NQLYKIGLDITPVIGAATAAEFAAFVSLYKQLPNVEAILHGRGENIPFPKEPSVRYATTIALTVRSNSVQESLHAFQWISDKASSEWIQLFATDLFRLARSRNELGKLATLAQHDPRLQKMFKDFIAMLESFNNGAA